MSGFEIIFPGVQPFAGIDLPTDVRVSCTYVDLDNYTIDLVEVPSRHDPICARNPADGWRIIDVRHALYRGNFLDDGIAHFLAEQSTVDKIEAEIARLMAEDNCRASRPLPAAWLAPVYFAEVHGLGGRR